MDAGSDAASCHAGPACRSDWICGPTADSCGQEVSCGACRGGATCREHACIATCQGCVIDGNCYFDAEADPHNPCRVCRPAVDRSAFGVVGDGTVCDAGSACVLDPRCQAGQCKGVAKDCDDGVACNGVEVCDPSTGSCSPGANTCATGVCDVASDQCTAICTSGCLVAGACYADRTRSSSNECLICDVAQSTTAFNPNSGAACEADANPCLSAGVCDATGRCVRTAVGVGTPCGQAANACAAWACDGSGACIPTFANVSTPCGAAPAACAAQDHCDGNGLCAAGDALALGSVCMGHGQCTGNASAPGCTCDQGYEPASDACVDVNECTRNLDGCDAEPDACSNDPGTYHCACPAGFSGDGVGASGCTCPRPDYSPLCAPWTEVSSQSKHACAISSGALFCWGANDKGQLGTGDTVERLHPTRVGTDTDWQKVSVGNSHSCGIRNGALYCWGDGGLGALGSSDAMLLVPTRVGADADWSAVGAGLLDTCGIRGSGELYCWGWNDYGQVGIGSSQTAVQSPQRVTTLTGWDTLGLNQTVACATRAGELYCWGYNQNFQIDGTRMNRTTPLRLATTIADWVAIDTNGFESCALRASGALYCWGSSSNSPTPTQVGSRSDWAAVTVGSPGPICGITRGGDGYCWGANDFGQIGDGTVVQRSAAQASLISGPSPWQQLEAGSNTTFGIHDGGLYAWGSNERGIRTVAPGLGRVGTSSDWLAISLAFEHACGLRSPGDLYCWGTMPADSNPASVTPLRIGTDSDWTQVAAGWLHTCAIRAGALYCWGTNLNGELGDGTTADHAAPARVGTFADWIAVGAGMAHTCAVRSNGNLYCFGDNSAGQLGDGSLTQRENPTPVAGTGWSMLSLSVNFRLAGRRAQLLG